MKEEIHFIILLIPTITKRSFSSDSLCLIQPLQYPVSG